MRPVVAATIMQGDEFVVATLSQPNGPEVGKLKKRD
jgi:hypothetical protein